MIKLTNAKNNRRLNEFDGFKEYVIQKNIEVKRVKNQTVIGKKIFVNERMPTNNTTEFDNIAQEKMLFYFF
ncbi:hypothetical protein HYU06_01370 [Candidatus Woesearchaeota archaeon]|nr:hypothetical protein [Candidatus Woesearchaeota archaeon]